MSWCPVLVQRLDTVYVDVSVFWERTSNVPTSSPSMWNENRKLLVFPLINVVNDRYEMSPVSPLELSTYIKCPEIRKTME
jgi:hypothetical protein